MSLGGHDPGVGAPNATARADRERRPTPAASGPTSGPSVPAGPRRRDLLLSFVVIGSGATAGLLWWRRVGGLEYRDLPTLPPFRELVSDGGISAASLAFAGLLQDDPSEAAAVLEARVAEVRADPCAALFGGAMDGDILPIAYFSDFNCPYCRVLEGELDQVLAADPGLRLVRHELPLLGGASLSAAKAVLAADRQGGYEELKARLLRAGLITDEPYLRAVSEPLGLDADRLLMDMESPEVADRLLTSRALGQVFGLVGTPALVIGQTVVIGSVTAGTIERVILDERAGSAPACGR